MATEVNAMSDMSSVKEELLSAISGNEVDPNGFADASMEVDSGEVGEEDIQDTSAADYVEPNPEEEKSAEGTAEPKVEANPEMLEVSVKSDEGDKVLKVDLSNKENLSKIVAKAYEAKALTQQLASVKAEHDLLKPQYTELKQVMDKIEEASQAGVHALVDLLFNEAGAFDRMVQEKVDERSFYETASPDQIEAYEAKKELKQFQNKDKVRNDRLAKETQAANKAKEEAELAQLTSALNTAFLKNSVSGEFADSEFEDSIDEMIWSKAKQSISQFPEGVAITQKLAEKEFARWKQHYLNLYSKHITKKTGDAVEKKKEDAATNISTTTSSKVKEANGDKKDLVSRANKATSTHEMTNIFRTLFGG